VNGAEALSALSESFAKAPASVSDKEIRVFFCIIDLCLSGRQGPLSATECRLLGYCAQRLDQLWKPQTGATPAG